MDRLSAFFLLTIIILAASARGDELSDTLFETRIRPVLATDCLPCHGGKKTESGLKVDSREALLHGGDRGPAIVVGEPDKSLLVRAIGHADQELKMPPKRHLPAEAQVAFAEWIAKGAFWPQSDAKKPAGQGGKPGRHWAFQRIKAEVPPLDPTGEASRPIDRFVAARRSAAGLQPVRPADRRTLIRRATFDLIGLPPTPEEVADFERDPSPNAFARVVDRLLASPQYGERWGRYWMDVVRYADTAGDNADYPVPEAARYRDFIVDSFNRDKPFDQFVREQLAGDIEARLGQADNHADAVVATGFLALSRRYATAPFELWHLTLEDTIETTGRAFLGLTLRCARCHDHKFDPVSQRDYYALYGIFASTTFPYAGSEELQSKGFPRLNFVPLAEPARAEPRVKAYHEQIEKLERTIQAIEAKKDESSVRHLKELQAQLQKLKRPSLPPDLPGAYAVTDGKPADVALQRRGDPGTPGEVVPRGVPRFAFLDGEPARAVPSHASGRLELAHWITRPDNPLTPRVMVNRIWQHHFGRGIVATPSNFGTRGEPPSHPELLDWLADRFVASGWSVKSIQREIVLSQTYQLSSDLDSHNATLDPDNRWLWRFPRQRLDAEALRDAMLAVSGNLNESRPGPHPFPAIESWQWTQHNAFKAVYPSNHRAIYLMTQRLVKHPYLAIFDGPDTNVSTEARTNSTVPLQALYLMNNPFVQEQAAGLVRRLIAASPDPAQRIEMAYRLAWSRPPTTDDCSRAQEFVKAAQLSLAKSGEPTAFCEHEAWASGAKVMITANEFLYID
jgi:hypothetical protein